MKLSDLFWAWAESHPLTLIAFVAIALAFLLAVVVGACLRVAP